ARQAHGPRRRAAGRQRRECTGQDGGPGSRRLYRRRAADRGGSGDGKRAAHRAGGRSRGNDDPRIRTGGNRMSIRKDPDAPSYLALGRRQFLLASGAVGLAGAAGLRSAWAEDSIVVADPGGPFGEGFKVAFHEPWAAAGHRSVQVPREHEPTAQFKAMV